MQGHGTDVRNVLAAHFSREVKKVASGGHVFLQPGNDHVNAMLRARTDLARTKGEALGARRPAEGLTTSSFTATLATCGGLAGKPRGRTHWG